jgi:hypothetical protein
LQGDDPVRLGEEVGETLLQRGGDAILEEVYGEGFAESSKMAVDRFSGCLKSSR